MGFKLSDIYFVIVSIILSSCSISKELREERKEWSYNTWESKYKDRAFCLCVTNGYDDKNIENILIENDRFFYKPLSIAIFDNSLESIILEK